MRLDISTLAETCACGRNDCNCKSGDTSNYTNYGQDHNIVDSSAWGEDPATNTKNNPAIAAAKTAGGFAYPHTIRNGINAKSPKNYNFKEINPKFHFDDIERIEKDSFKIGEKNGFGM
jgi:hypothetical protein